MAKAAQYFNGITWSQWPAGGLTTDDYTLNTGIIADQFQTIKDSQDNLYIICNYSGSQISAGSNVAKSKVIKLSKTGVILATYTYSSGANYATLVNPILSKDQETIFFSDYNAVIVTMNAGVFTTSSIVANKFAIYKDLYIWVAVIGYTYVSLYNYGTKQPIVVNTTCGWGNTDGSSLCICANPNEQELFVLGWHYDSSENQWTRITRMVFNGTNTLTPTGTTLLVNYNMNAKQLLIDPFGDLIILTNSGTASTLLKYTTAGVLIDTLDLAAPSYNLAIDTKGNYYYQTASATFKIAKNTIQGQAFNPIPAEPIRATGNIGYGSNMTGYQPSVYA